MSRTRLLSRHSTWVRADRFRKGWGPDARVQYQAEGTTPDRPWGVVVEKKKGS